MNLVYGYDFMNFMTTAAVQKASHNLLIDLLLYCHRLRTQNSIDRCVSNVVCRCMITYGYRLHRLRSRRYAHIIVRC